ncbi:hypothetical protein PR202_ga08751 [Eleusine coracana subsp. coracana]|uniref:Uncharacterized protein n=1 Tax=Eleusine coracana subsp. coracana TaxID=191504 RepID=A0AAV5C128_ELECO|nr:hypothetical protein PR202_ga08751 [Eleusine coracana subsp. coracana]
MKSIRSIYQAILPLDFIRVGDLASVHDLGTYVSLLKNNHQPGTEERPRDGVMAKVMEFVGRRRAGAAVPWQDAAMQTLGLVQTLGLS